MPTTDHSFAVYCKQIDMSYEEYAALTIPFLEADEALVDKVTYSLCDEVL